LFLNRHSSQKQHMEQSVGELEGNFPTDINIDDVREDI